MKNVAFSVNPFSAGPQGPDLPIAGSDEKQLMARASRPGKNMRREPSQLAMPNAPRATPGVRLRPGFTLVELLVVIALMTLLIGMTYPTMNMLIGTSRVDAGVNTVGAAATAIRAYATQPHADLDPDVPGAHYVGTALVFIEATTPTPTTEIHLCINNQTAYDSGNYLQSSSHNPPSVNGYSDFASREPIRMPIGVGIAGIIQPGTPPLAWPFVSTNTPPGGFALRFDKNGQLVTGDSYSSSKSSEVFYGSNWQEMPAVPAVVVFSKSEAQQNNLLPTNSNPNPATTVDNLINLAHGKVVLFSRYTGAALKQQ